MTTVVDELVLRFNLDATNFNQGQQKTIQQLRRFESEARDAGRGTEDAAQKMVDGFSRVTKEVLGLGAAFLGVSGLKELVVGTVTAGANLDVMTKALNLNAEALNRWQNVGRSFGVTAETTASAIGNFQTLLQQYREGKVGPEAFGLPSLNALAGITDNDLRTQNVYELLNRIHKGAVANPADAAGLLAGTPAAPLLPTLIQPDLDKRLDEALNLTRDQAKAAQEVRDEFTKLTVLLEGRFNQAILNNIRPIKEMIDAVRKLANGDFSGAEAINQKLGDQAHEGLSGIGATLWDYLNPLRTMERGMGLPAGALGGPPARSGGGGAVNPPDDDGGPSMPLPRGRPSAGSYTSADVDADVERGFTGGRGTGRWIAPYMNVPTRHDSAHAGGFGNFGTVNNDNSHAISIAHVSVTPPPGVDERAWANSFISAVTAQASSGAR